MGFIVEIHWPDRPSSEEGFETIEQANIRIQEIQAMPWVVPAPTWYVYDDNGELVECSE